MNGSAAWAGYEPNSRWEARERFLSFRIEQSLLSELQMQPFKSSLKLANSLLFHAADDYLVSTARSIDIDAPLNQHGHPFSQVDAQSFKRRSPKHCRDLAGRILDGQVNVPGSRLIEISDFAG